MVGGDQRCLEQNRQICWYDDEVQRWRQVRAWDWLLVYHLVWNFDMQGFHNKQGSIFVGTCTRIWLRSFRWRWWQSPQKTCGAVARTSLQTGIMLYHKVSNKPNRIDEETLHHIRLWGHQYASKTLESQMRTANFRVRKLAWIEWLHNQDGRWIQWVDILIAPHQAHPF